MHGVKWYYRTRDICWVHNIYCCVTWQTRQNFHNDKPNLLSDIPQIPNTFPPRVQKYFAPRSRVERQTIRLIDGRPSTAGDMPARPRREATARRHISWVAFKAKATTASTYRVANRKLKLIVSNRITNNKLFYSFSDGSMNERREWARGGISC